jgi:hypothetical protein
MQLKEMLCANNPYPANPANASGFLPCSLFTSMPMV